MKAVVKWLDNMSFVGESESGHSIVMDGPPESGGRNLGVRPMEMVLLGMGGCTAFDVVLILQRQRQSITDCQVELSAERAADVPKVFTKIHIEYYFYGDVKQNDVEMAINLSQEKYCSAAAMLQKTAEVTHDYHINQAID